MSVYSLKIGPMYEIRDARTDRVLTRGYIHAMKDSAPPDRTANLVSLDDKWFFNIDRTDLFRLVTTSEHQVMALAEEDINKIGPRLWRDCVNDAELAPLYREFTKSELDPEIEPLVTELNKWPGIQTIGSCCGHGNGPAWVSMNVHDLIALDEILRPVRNMNCPSKDILGQFIIALSEDRGTFSNYPPAMTHSDYYENIETSHPLYLVIATKKTGYDAYSDVRTYANLLKDLRGRLKHFEKKGGC